MSAGTGHRPQRAGQDLVRMESLRLKGAEGGLCTSSTIKRCIVEEKSKKLREKQSSLVEGQVQFLKDS